MNHKKKLRKISGASEIFFKQENIKNLPINQCLDPESNKELKK